jgi:ABC-type transport system involved in cytochrome c biogenesis permease component
VVIPTNVVLPFCAVLAGADIYQYVMLTVSLFVLTCVIGAPGAVEVILRLPRSEPPATEHGH